jgi:hypothetical protein
MRLGDMGVFMTRTIFAIALLGATSLAGASQASTIAALVGDNTIAMVDTASLKVTGTMKTSGASGRILGIDVRPADGMLYAVTADGVAWTIDAKSGKATQKSKFDMAPPTGMVTVDFNPVADRLRVMGSDGMNLRINVDDGKVTKDGDLKYAESDMHKGEKPNVVAGAYTNSVKGAKETTLYNIDATIGALVRQAPPNDGVLNVIGKLGMTPKSVAFDIAAGEAAGTGWLMADGTLYRVDLATGKATMAGKVSGVSGPVRDIAIMPAM